MKDTGILSSGLILLTFYAITFLISPLYAAKLSWPTILSTYQQIIPKKTYDFIYRQYLNYHEGIAPKIAANVIKEIPIKESSEPLVNIDKLDYARITMLPKPIIPYTKIELYSAGTEASSLIRKSVYQRLEKMIDALDQLAPSFGYNKGQLNIKVFEGLRSLSTQTLSFNIKVANLMLTQFMSYHEAIKNAATFVSPVENNIPVHCTGAAIDIRLWNTTLDSFVDMGPFGALGNDEILPTFSESINEEQKKNRLLWVSAAAAAGLANYPYEWWHFSYGDRYWSYCFEGENPSAIYGLIE